MKKSRKILIVVLAAVAAFAAVFFIYVSDYYRADQTARAVFENGEGIVQDGNLIILTPPDPGDTGLIFYPGGKVEAISYLPLLSKLQDNGITCVLAEMPFNLAVFDINAADRVYEKLPQIKNWYIGGHSLGGAMASAYAGGHMDRIRGLILLGAYIYGDINADDALTVYGTEDQGLEKIDYTTNVIVIDGGNHAQFGNYGPQDGDGEATILPETQQDIAVQSILDFIKTHA
jgi:pimeloyl-ACP methyl ester carboxylesterase